HSDSRGQARPSPVCPLGSEQGGPMALYKSAYSAFMVLVRSEAVMYHPATGVEINRIPALTAEFGEHGGTFNMENPLTGQLEENASINGHFFDSEAAQGSGVRGETKRAARREPYLVMRVEIEHAPARKPWPTYDEMNAEAVLAFANVAGLLREGLGYGQESKGGG